jgi:hypothetical protein
MVTVTARYWNMTVTNRRLLNIIERDNTAKPSLILKCLL